MCIPHYSNILDINSLINIQGRVIGGSREGSELIRDGDSGGGNDGGNGGGGGMGSEGMVGSEGCTLGLGCRSRERLQIWNWSCGERMMRQNRL